MARSATHGGRRTVQYAQLAGPVDRLHARAAVELAQDVAHMHVDGAWAEEQIAGDLAVRAPHRDEAYHLELPARQPGRLVARAGAASQPAGHRAAVARR